MSTPVEKSTELLVAEPSTLLEVESTEVQAAKSTETQAAKSTEVQAAKSTEVQVAKSTETQAAKSTEVQAAKSTEVQVARAAEAQEAQASAEVQPSLYVLVTGRGYVGTFATLQEAEGLKIRFPDIQFLTVRYRRRLKEVPKLVWVVFYKDTNIVAMVSDDRAAAEKHRVKLLSVGLASNEDLTYWEQEVGSISPMMEEIMSAQQNAHRMYAGNEGFVDLGNSRARDQYYLDLITGSSTEYAKKIGETCSSEQGIDYTIEQPDISDYLELCSSNEIPAQPDGSASNEITSETGSASS